MRRNAGTGRCRNQAGTVRLVRRNCPAVVGQRPCHPRTHGTEDDDRLRRPSAKPPLRPHPRPRGRAHCGRGSPGARALGPSRSSGSRSARSATSWRTIVPPPAPPAPLSKGDDAQPIMGRPGPSAAAEGAFAAGAFALGEGNCRQATCRPWPTGTRSPLAKETGANGRHERRGVRPGRNPAMHGAARPGSVRPGRNPGRHGTRRPSGGGFRVADAGRPTRRRSGYLRRLAKQVSQ